MSMIAGRKGDLGAQGIPIWVLPSAVVAEIMNGSMHLAEQQIEVTIRVQIGQGRSCVTG